MLFKSAIFPFSLIVLLFLFQSVSAQDQVFQLYGANLEGNVIIYYEDDEDIILLDRRQLEPDEIEKVIIFSGNILYNKRLLYYNPRRGHIIEKFVLLDPIVKGEATLYSYAGQNFDFVLSIDDILFALQDLEEGEGRGVAKNYKKILSENLGNCVTTNDIETLSYDRKALRSLIKNYNHCKTGRPDFETISANKNNITSISVHTGLSHASHSLQTQLLFDRDFVDQKNVPSNNVALGVFFQNNLFNSKNLFFELGASYRRLNFQVQSVEKEISVDNLAVNEFSIGTGLNYKFIPSAKLSPEVTLGAYAWSMSGHNNMYPETTRSFAALPSRYSSLAGVGGSFRGLLNYEIANDIHVFVAGTYLLKSREDAFTDRVPDDLKGQINDSLTDNYTITFGLTFSNSR